MLGLLVLAANIAFIVLRRDHARRMQQHHEHIATLNRQQPIWRR